MLMIIIILCCIVIWLYSNRNKMNERSALYKLYRNSWYQWVTVLTVSKGLKTIVVLSYDTCNDMLYFWYQSVVMSLWMYTYIYVFTKLLTPFYGKSWIQVKNNWKGQQQLKKYFYVIVQQGIYLAFLYLSRLR